MLDLTNFKNIVSDLVYYLDDVNGNRLYRKLSNADIKEIGQDQEKMAAFLSLEFLIIPFLSTEEIAGILKNQLLVGLMLDDINLVERITKKLIYLDLMDRDNCKKTLKNALVNSQVRLTDTVVAENKKLFTASDWIKDFISLMKGKSINVLNEAEYLYQKPYFIKLKETDKKLLKKLFVLYKFLDTSSLTPEGFEDDLLIEDEHGRLMTTDKGRVVVLFDPAKSKEKIGASNIVLRKNRKIIELRRLAAQYPPGSLERKAVEEEIRNQEAGSREQE
jgi:hypothetical protein